MTSYEFRLVQWMTDDGEGMDCFADELEELSSDGWELVSHTTCAVTLKEGEVVALQSALMRRPKAAADAS